jgi:hypothetical protein
MPTDTNPPTETPPETPPEVSPELQKLQEQMAALQDQFAAKERESKLQQARADRAEHLLKVRAAVQPQNQNPPNPRGVQLPPQTPPTNLDETADILQENERELLLLREVVRRGISLEEVQSVGIVFNTPDELKIQLDLYQQQKEIETLKQSLKAQEESPPSGPTIDAGGRTTGTEAEQQLQGQIAAVRNQAKELRGKQQYTEATWLALRAAQLDPNKRLLVRNEPE